MPASFPSSVKAFTTKSDGAGNTILAAHINDLQAEVTAIEQCLLGTVALSPVFGGTLTVSGTSTLAAVNASGTLTVSGFGTHSFSSGGTGANVVTIANTTAGTGNYGLLTLGADASASTFNLYQTSSSFTASGINPQNGGVINVAGAGGFNIAATHGSGAIRFYTGGSTERMSLSSAGLLTVGDLVTGTTGRIRLGNTSVANYAVLSIEGTHSVSGSGGGALYISPTVNVDAGEIAGTALIRTSGGFVEAASGTNPLLAGISIGVPSVTTTGSQTTTNTASLYVAGAMTAGTTANYALWVAAGGVRLGAFGAGTATFDASGNLSSVSDERMKDRISDLGYGLAEILALRPVRYGYNALSGLERDHLYGGFIAQDVQRVMPLAVNTNADGYLSLSDRPITGALVTAIQQHDATIQSLAARIAALESARG